MIGMPSEYALGAIDLLGQQGASQHVRPSEGAEGHHEVGFFAHGVVESVRAADDEANRAHAVVTPAAEAFGEGVASLGAAALVERDDARALRQRRQQGFALPGAAHVRRKILLDLDFLQIYAPGQACEVALVKIALGAGLGLADGGDDNIERAGVQARFAGFFVGEGAVQMRSI